MSPISKKLLITLFISAFIVYIIGMFTDIMDLDAAQYASISREMLQNGNYLIVKYSHKHYLDKPPLLFWLSSLSFRMLGISNFTYRLPSFLFTLLGIFSTFRLGRLLYNEKIGIFAAWVLFTCQAYFLFNLDVRTDTILAGSVIFSIWQIAEYIKTNKVINFILSCIGVAAAMLAKGPIGIMVPVVAFGTHFMYKKNWKGLFRWQWLAGAAIVLILLSPMLWGLYQHSVEYPNNPIYQKDKFYGIKFYFWIQSFGRITGENQWRNANDPTFFIHTFLWSFLPWSVLAFAGIGRNLIIAFKKKTRLNPSSEAITLGGVVLPFIAFSLSKYVLPHYIFVFYSLAAIITAKMLEHIFQTDNSLFKFFLRIQYFIVFLIWSLGFTICFFLFPTKNIWIWLIYILTIIFSILYSRLKYSKEIRLMVPSTIAIIGLNFILNFHFYPELLKYQSDTQVAKIMEATEISKNRVFSYKLTRPSFKFYTGRITANINDVRDLYNLAKQKKIWIYTDQKGMELVNKLAIKPEKIDTLNDYPVTKLSLKFLNPKTREKTLSKTYFLKF